MFRSSETMGMFASTLARAQAASIKKSCWLRQDRWP
jgi:hypothetical protein